MPNADDSVKSIDQKIADIVAKNVQLTNENQQLLQQLDQLNNIVDEIETERTKNDLIEADIVTFERKLSEISAKISRAPNSLQQNSSGIIKELNQNLDKELDENNRLRMKITELDEKNCALSDKIALFENDNAAVEIEQKLTEEIQQLKEKIASSKNENIAATQLIEKLKEEIEILRNKIIHTENENVAAVGFAQKSADEIRQLTENNKNLNNKINKLTEENQTLFDQSQELIANSFEKNGLYLPDQL